MTHEEADAAIEQVIEFAASLKLHGVLLLSPVCPDCGRCHDFHLFSDLTLPETHELMDGWRDLVDPDDPEERSLPMPQGGVQ